MALGKKDFDDIRQAVEFGTAPLAARIASLEANAALFGSEGPLEPVLQELRELRAEMRDNFADLFRGDAKRQALAQRIDVIEKKCA